MATRRTGKPYLWVTWLAKLLGGQQCYWRVWFQAHFKYDKYNEEALDLAKWNREHTRMMQARVRELEEAGWTITTEDQNAFKLEGAAAVVAGKPDIVASQPGHVLVVDAKTGRQRESDIWQVLLYLFAIPKSRPDLTGALEGELQYKNGDGLTLTPEELTAQRMNDIVGLIRIVAADEPPVKKPSRDECRRCDIGFADCPQRVGAKADKTTLVGEF